MNLIFCTNTLSLTMQPFRGTHKAYVTLKEVRDFKLLKAAYFYYFTVYACAKNHILTAKALFEWV